jgi:hypothetical protein
MAPKVFWGHSVARGREAVGLAATSQALILMGDWCGPEKGLTPHERKLGRGAVNPVPGGQRQVSA